MNTYTIILGKERAEVEADYINIDPAGLGTFLYVGSELVAVVSIQGAVIKQSK